MKLLLLCLGLTVVCAYHKGKRDIVKCNLDMSKISGRWYTILLASSRRNIIEENGSMRMFAKHTEVLGNSSLLFKYDKKVKGVCTELTFVTNETKEKGVYSVTYEGYNTFYIIEAVYDKYVIFHNMNFHNGRKTDVIELNARRPYVNKRLKKRFEEICRNRGIPTEHILDVSKTDRCLQTRWRPGAQAYGKWMSYEAVVTPSPPPIMTSES
ncbi:allergen Fel d 4-like [Desmodus rotundus]|uniref:allergen Fel d 4-like n=1 Tax=Desmodus rotundus TaxID=9430 RepID=UPI0023814C28|nr:allergen Fel d 4-like [Desmodus rotundus]